MPISYVIGDILKAKTDVIVNPANTVGVMGAGVALRIKQEFPESYPPYAQACNTNCLTVSKPLIVPLRGKNPSWIIHLATKNHWRHPSQLSYVEQGLKGLVDILQLNKEIRSISIPALGCGLGGLDWGCVKILIETYLAEVPDVDVQVFLPHEK